MSENAHFERLWDRCNRQVHAYALRRTDPATAQDVVAETFLIAWRRRDEVASADLPWLLGVARLVLANDARSRRRREALAGVLIETARRHHADAAEVDHELLRALAGLRPEDREALLLTGWDGLSPSDAARVAGCTGPAFRARHMRARRRLARALEAAPAECPTTPATERP